MGEKACYMDLLDADGRLHDSPVILWPLESELPIPLGLRVMVGSEEPPADLWPLRLPELAGADRARLESPESARHVEMLVRAALEGRVVLLFQEPERETALALAEIVHRRLATVER